MTCTRGPRRRDPWPFRPAPPQTRGPAHTGPDLRTASDLERTTGFEPATPTLAIAWRLSHTSPQVSAAPLSCAFLALLSHPSHQIAGVDSVSLVISLVCGNTDSRSDQNRSIHQWLHRRGRPENSTSTSPTFVKPFFSQMRLEAPFVTPGKRGAARTCARSAPAPASRAQPGWRARGPGTPAGSSTRSRRCPPRRGTSGRYRRCRPARPSRPGIFIGQHSPSAARSSDFAWARSMSSFGLGPPSSDISPGSVCIRTRSSTSSSVISSSRITAPLPLDSPSLRVEAHARAAGLACAPESYPSQPSETPHPTVGGWRGARSPRDGRPATCRGSEASLASAAGATPMRPEPQRRRGPSDVRELARSSERARARQGHQDDSRSAYLTLVGDRRPVLRRQMVHEEPPRTTTETDPCFQDLHTGYDGLVPVMPERPLSSTSVGSPNEKSPERCASSRTSRETRISPPRASAAIRAARTTSFP